MNLENTYICTVCGITCMWASTRGRYEDIDEKGYCPFCRGEMIDTNIEFLDFIKKSKKDPDFENNLIETMVKPLGKFDPSKQKKSNKSIELRRASSSSIKPTNIPKCPTCQSTNIRKIGGIERGTSIAVFGLFSKKINKTFKCNNCDYTW